MSLKGLLRSVMYQDRVTVRRQTNTFDDEGAACSKLGDVYTDVPCKLSQYGKMLASHQEDRAFVLSNDLRLCCDPVIDIRPNDVLMVTHQGELWRLRAGKAFLYPTHQEIQAQKAGESNDSVGIRRTGKQAQQDSAGDAGET